MSANKIVGALGYFCSHLEDGLRVLIIKNFPENVINNNQVCRWQRSVFLQNVSADPSIVCSSSSDCLMKAEQLYANKMANTTRTCNLFVNRPQFIMPLRILDFVQFK